MPGRRARRGIVQQLADTRMEARKQIYIFSGIGAAAFIVYLATLSRNYLGDGVQFLMATESSHVSLMPNHMLYDASIFAWYALWKLLGWTGNAILPLQMFSAFWGAVSVALFAFLVLRMTGMWRVTALVSFGFGTCFAVWLFSTDVEVVTFPLALNIALLVFAIALPPHRLAAPRNAVAAGLLTAAAILSYETGVFMVPVIGLAYILGDFGKAASKIRLIGIYLLTVFVIVSGCHLLVAHVVYGVSTLKGFVHWQLSLQEVGLWGVFSRQSFPTGTLGLMRSLAGFPGLNYLAGIRTFFMFAAMWQKVLFVSYYAVLSAMWVYITSMLIVRRRALLARWRLPLVLFTVSAFLYAAFALYWIPADIQFWVPVVASWWGAIALVLALQADREQGGAPGLLSSAPGAVAVAFVCIISIVNFFGTVLPDTRTANNAEYNIAAALKDKARKDDLIITSGTDRLFLYIPYFTDRKTLSIFGLGMQGRKGEKLLSEIDRRIRDALSAGNDVYLAGMRPGRFVLWKEMNRLGVDRAFAGRYQTEVCSRVGDEEILRLAPPKGPTK